MAAFNGPSYPQVNAYDGGTNFSDMLEIQIAAMSAPDFQNRVMELLPAGVRDLLNARPPIQLKELKQRSSEMGWHFILIEYFDYLEEIVKVSPPCWTVDPEHRQRCLVNCVDLGAISNLRNGFNIRLVTATINPGTTTIKIPVMAFKEARIGSQVAVRRIIADNPGLQPGRAISILGGRSNSNGSRINQNGIRMGSINTSQQTVDQDHINHEQLDPIAYADDIGFPNVVPEGEDVSEDEPSGEYSEEE